MLCVQVYYLETRVNNLEALLSDHGITYPPPSEDFSISDAIKPGFNVPFPAQDDAGPLAKSPASAVDSTLDPALREPESPAKLDELVHNVGMVSVQGTSDARLQPSNSGTSSGIPFSRVVFAAVKSSVSQAPSERGSMKPARPLPSATASGGGGSSSFFALHTRPSVKAAPFPDKAVGHRLVELYFEHANPQIPILHRSEFMSLFDRVYATEAKKRTSRELYLVNIVFAIGSGVIMDSSNAEQTMPSATTSAADAGEPPNKKRHRAIGQQHQPEEYHSAAIAHLDSFLGSTPAAEGVGGGLEELQAVLLLAGLALLRPVAPGLWYIIGVAVRLAIDLGLHFEDSDLELDGSVTYGGSTPKGVGRKQWTKDLKRRLWWCTYSFDRLVSTCVGRPFGIADHVITTPFPSMLDDRSITTAGFLCPPHTHEAPSYKYVAQHYFQLRLLQSEILQVLQHRQADRIRVANAQTRHRPKEHMRTELSVPYMEGFHSFREWRVDVDYRLREWKDSAPSQLETGVAFEPLFLELNYWQAIIMLYRQSLAVPEPLAGEVSPSTGEDVQSPGTLNLEPNEDEQMVFMKVAQAGQTVLKIYRQLHRLKLVNYTFLATHHLFMSGKSFHAWRYLNRRLTITAGISFLYAIWHSTLVRSQLSLDDVDFTVLIATSVLSDLMEKCPPAEACRDAFVRMSKATISMCMSTTGFGPNSTLGTQTLSQGGYFGLSSRSNPGAQPQQQPRRMPLPKFDMNLKDLFSEEEIANRPSAHQLKDLDFALPLFRSPYAAQQQHQPSSIVQQPNEPFRSPSNHGASPAAFSNHPNSPLSLKPRPTQQQQIQSQQSQQLQPASSSYPSTSDLPFDFLDAFPLSDPTNAFSWMTANNNNTTYGELDLGFGTGGTAGTYLFEGEGDDGGGDVDLFDGFFFGGGGGGGGY